MKLTETIDVISCELINLTSSVSQMVESLESHDPRDIKRIIGKIENTQDLLTQTISNLESVRKNVRQLGHQDLEKIVNDIVSNMNIFKKSTISLIHCLAINKFDTGSVSNHLKKSRDFIKRLNASLDRLNFPSDSKNKVLHYQSNEVKKDLQSIPNRELFRAVFNEAHYGHHHHNHNKANPRKFGPEFNSRGEWFHDGIMTRWNGKELEDIYLQPNGKTISCGFIVKDTNTGKYLGCHPTGNPRDIYDIPKGGLKVGANELDTAIRELEEETGIKLSGNENIKDLGKHESKKDKDVYLFYVELPIELDKLHCDSTFIDFRDNTEKPEMDRFELLDGKDKFLFSLQNALSKFI